MSLPIVGRQEIEPHQEFGGHTSPVRGAIHLPGGQRIMTCSSDGSLRVWDMKSGKQIGDDWRDTDSPVWTMALSPDGKKVVSGSDDGGLRLWNVDTGKIIMKWMGHTKPVVSVCWSGDGQRVLSGSYDGTARQWDVESGEAYLAQIKTGHGCVLAVVYSPDITMFATGDARHSFIKIWDAKTGKLVATLEAADSVWGLAWTRDGKTLISGSRKGQIAVLDGHTWGVESIAISPNGRILASASHDMTARLWNLENNQPIGSPLQRVHFVRSVSFSADGKLLATGCSDKNAYTWDVCGILKEAGLSELLLDKPVLAADAKPTPRPVRQPIIVPQRRVPHGFFDGLPDRAHVSPRHSRSWASHASTLRDRFSSLFHSDAHDTSSRPHPFHWVRNHLSASGRPSGKDIEPHERPSVVDVSHCQAQRRYASAHERRRPIIPLKSKKPTSRPPNSNTIQQSSGTTQAQSSSKSHAAVPTSAIPSVVTNTPSNTNPHATMRHVGRWTRFWLFICCASTEYTHDHQ
ncbi:WD40-repeat-containing domain protein [Suillus variegatus]|nr:WD40-repeat-containing domain protein [Suillus variegatus]